MADHVYEWPPAEGDGGLLYPLQPTPRRVRSERFQLVVAIVQVPLWIVVTVFNVLTVASHLTIGLDVLIVALAVVGLVVLLRKRRRAASQPA